MLLFKSIPTENLLQNFTEIEFKLNNGNWCKACFDTEKIDQVIEHLSTFTEVRKTSP